MVIIIETTAFETKEIVDIRDVEANKKYFLNREAGFIITLIDGREFRFSENIPYESYPREIGQIKTRWKEKQKEVETLWHQDKIDHPRVKL